MILLKCLFVEKSSPGTYTRTSWTNGTDRTNGAHRTLWIGKEKCHSSVKLWILLPGPHSSQVWRSEVKPMRMTAVRDQVLTHLQVHHGFHVCRWDPRGREDQVHPLHQQDQGCQGNHALPTKGKMKLSINLTCVLVAFKLGMDEQVYWPCVQPDHHGLGDHHFQDCPVKIPQPWRHLVRLCRPQAPVIQLFCLCHTQCSVVNPFSDC